MKHLLIACGALTTWLLAGAAAAGPGAEAAARLGKDLTPIGAEAAANQDGSIPAWSGGEPQHGDLAGEFPNDAAADAEKPLFSITSANLAQYTDRLTDGHRELLKRYADYRMNVYPTHRTVGFPEFIYKATAENAAHCSLGGTDLPDACSVGFPYPVPGSGAEVIWNHKLKWRGNAVQRYNNQFIVQPSGDYTQTKIVEQVRFRYATQDAPVQLRHGEGEFLNYLSKTLAPPRLANTFLLVQDRPGVGDAGRSAWIYSPGIRRIRRAPTVQYDNPYEGTDGNQFYDQVDMFNGALDRYDWKLLGKKEMYVPYNSNRIAGNKVRYADLIRPHHLNQDLPRYELHRCWVVEARLRSGSTHAFGTRRFYVDEDSWNIVAVDNYDKRDQLYKFQEGHLVYTANDQAATTVPEVIYDFFSGRYFITGAFNEDKPFDLTVKWSDDYFTSSALGHMVPQ